MWVSPFRYLWINAYLQLPAAFRSLSRLSSALSAKASTLRSLLLNHYVNEKLYIAEHQLLLVDVSSAILFITYIPLFTSSVMLLEGYLSDFSSRIFCFVEYLSIFASDVLYILFTNLIFLRFFQYSVFKEQICRCYSAVGLRRLELPTSRLSGVRSNRLSYKPSAYFIIGLYLHLPCDS